jgi:hypothetical protein
VLERLVVLRECLFSVPLLHQHIALRLERAGPVRSLCIGTFELRRRAGEVPALRKGYALGVVSLETVLVSGSLTVRSRTRLI